MAGAVVAGGEALSEHDLGGLLSQLAVPALREPQLECITAAVYRRQDVWAQLPCGSGKTLIVVAVVHLLKCIGVLVEPLSSIIDELVVDLPKRGVRAVHLTSKTVDVVCTLLRSFKVGKDKPVIAH